MAVAMNGRLAAQEAALLNRIEAVAADVAHVKELLADLHRQGPSRPVACFRQ